MSSVPRDVAHGLLQSWALCREDESLHVVGKERPDAFEWNISLYVGRQAFVSFLQLVDDGIGIPQSDLEEESTRLLPGRLGEATPTDQQSPLRSECAHYPLKSRRVGASATMAPDLT